MSATHYDSKSKGRIEIASMQYDHAVRTHALLTRENGDPETIDAIAARIAAVEATFEEPKP